MEGGPCLLLILLFNCPSYIDLALRRKLKHFWFISTCTVNNWYFQVWLYISHGFHPSSLYFTYFIYLFIYLKNQLFVVVFFLWFFFFLIYRLPFLIIYSWKKIKMHACKFHLQVKFYLSWISTPFCHSQSPVVISYDLWPDVFLSFEIFSFSYLII